MQKVDLPASWVWTTVADLGRVFSGGTPSTKEPSYWGSDIAWISPSDLTGYASKFIARGAKSISSKGLKNSSAVVMPAGSVHFSSRAPIGYVAIAANEVSTNQGFKSLTPAVGVFNEYIYYYFKSAKQLAESLATGTTFKEISGAAFSRMPVPLAPEREQQRIVAKLEELFSELDKGVENLRTAQQQLKVYRQALLKHAFEGKLTAEWRAQNPDKLESAEALLARIQQEREARYRQQLAEWQEAQQAWEANGKTGSKPAKPKAPKVLPALTAEDLAELPELPAGWAWLCVSHLLAEDLCNGKSVKDRSGGFPVLRLNALANGRINLSVTKPGDWDEDEARQYFVQKGDFLVSRGNGSKHLVGRGGFAHYKSTKFCHVAFPDTMIRIRLLPESVCQGYFGFCWDSPLLRRQIEKHARTTAGIYKINQELIAGFILPLPCREEQELIERMLSEKLSNLEQLENTIATSLQQAEALRQSILKKAFSGQLVPQHPDDEPASVLLARIRAERAAQPKARGRKSRAEA
ncbi:restriction endonuclease subunit S [Thauera aminoaromatica]|uniref:Restriction endonuclease n=1 Tax=Thauera aminoaromatica TaxID=164330 RepID=A0A5C7SM87_THASP|nr:restriction endonuclease subunit S [Thauera aminoaromatica]TXH84136.1 MAG: restriction endonuclease [Thauera aminoaromatica]